LNCGHAVVRRLIVDSLRLWVQDYRFDGFAFLNAEALTHGR
jgi:pullulanase/glycogen debranching enzyme